MAAHAVRSISMAIGLNLNGVWFQIRIHVHRCWCCIMIFESNAEKYNQIPTPNFHRFINKMFTSKEPCSPFKPSESGQNINQAIDWLTFIEFHGMCPSELKAKHSRDFCWAILQNAGLLHVEMFIKKNCPCWRVDAHFSGNLTLSRLIAYWNIHWSVNWLEKGGEHLREFLNNQWRYSAALTSQIHWRCLTNVSVASETPWSE